MATYDLTHQSSMPDFVALVAMVYLTPNRVRLREAYRIAKRTAESFDLPSMPILQAVHEMRARHSVVHRRFFRTAGLPNHRRNSRKEA